MQGAVICVKNFDVSLKNCGQPLKCHDQVCVEK